MVTIAERDGALFLMFHKTGEGLWAEGPVQVCGKEGDLQARIPENLLRVGPAAHWIVRRALRNDPRFSLRRDSTGQLAIATAGWSSQFTASGD
ncbi:MAG: hypothetical protein ABIU07_09615 [Ramlibacter sp.]